MTPQTGAQHGTPGSPAKKEFDPQRERGGTVPRYYEVFARQDSDHALSHVGSVEAPNDELAQVRAWYIYDQHKWKEMCVVPTETIIPVQLRNHSTRIKMV